ncbi:hypothetical protein [Cohnella yongneupensis]|uniref:YgiT-type zinc finger protein n=1 Tax=Cohnella yongneupensis TaxID=425006 RepID=A0ABW0RA94_9BACL
MLKLCSCGEQMALSLRTVIFAKKVNITNVPVYSCDICGRNDVFHGVKDDVGRLISQLGAVSDSRSIPFDQVHEWASLLSDLRTQMKKLQPSDVARATEERTNQLLDLLNLASSLGDESWKQEIQSRLAQLSAQYIL